MKALIVACSAAAHERMLHLEEAWKKQDPEAKISCLVKCAALPDISEERPLGECVGEYFGRVDAIVFICAAGIAVRSIAPWLVHKSKDPAVIVMDETGKFCISLLSGHWGGGNGLAERISRMTGAVCVITTATDREEKFAVDVFAKNNGLVLTDWKLAKKISARILNGERIGLYSALPLKGTVPGELVLSGKMTKENGETKEAEAGGTAPRAAARDGAQKLGIAVSFQRADGLRFESTLQLIPKAVFAGIGCKRGTSREKIEAAVSRCLIQAGICPEALCSVASIDQKKDEEGLCAWCKEKKLPFVTYPAEVLKRIKGDFAESAFVESVTGVSNVCERSAVAAAGKQGVLLCRKTVFDGVTVALAWRKGSVKF